jgi:putative nucleotidyltransferase with HDIG domain
MSNPSSSGNYDIDSIIRKIKRISTLPTIFLKVNDLLKDPDSTAMDLAKVISGDQGLTSGLLKLVNSAYYSFPRRIGTVAEAIAIIGFQQLSDLVLGATVMRLFSGTGEGSPFTPKEFWRHSLSVAVFSRILAVSGRDSNHETSFVAGLLHDIGRMVLLESLPEQYLKIIESVEKRSMLIADAEQEVLGFTHADVGGRLITHWRLPDSLVQAAMRHHSPKDIKSSPHADRVHVANILAHSLAMGKNGEKYVPSLLPSAWERLGLRIEDLAGVFVQFNRQYYDAESFFIRS